MQAITEKKMINWTPLKLEMLVLQKTPFEKWKYKPHIGEIFSYHISDEGLSSRIYKNSFNSVKYPTTQTKSGKRLEHSNRHFSKPSTQMTYKHMERYLSLVIKKAPQPLE